MLTMFIVYICSICGFLGLSYLLNHREPFTTQDVLLRIAGFSVGFWGWQLLVGGGV